MEIRSGVKLSKDEVVGLLNRFDDSSYLPFHEDLDFDSYGEKLSRHAWFVLAEEKGILMGFIAYYLNEEEHFVYVPQTVVHTDSRHTGLGHLMFSSLYSQVVGYNCIHLEVMKDNTQALAFYTREGFSVKSESSDRYFLSKNIRKSSTSEKLKYTQCGYEVTNGAKQNYRLKR